MEASSLCHAPDPIHAVSAEADVGPGSVRAAALALLLGAVAITASPARAAASERSSTPPAPRLTQAEDRAVSLASVSAVGDESWATRDGQVQGRHRAVSRSGKPDRRAARAACSPASPR